MMNAAEPTQAKQLFPQAPRGDGVVQTLLPDCIGIEWCCSSFRTVELEYNMMEKLMARHVRGQMQAPRPNAGVQYKRKKRGTGTYDQIETNNNNIDQRNDAQ